MLKQYDADIACYATLEFSQSVWNVMKTILFFAMYCGANSHASRETLEEKFGTNNHDLFTAVFVFSGVAAFDQVARTSTDGSQRHGKVKH